mmetsp:Transcript_106327/g.266340  ORF Transcript_106327/g.266340 Transcript_106327/m.266340 type:complete len:251 (-) Transcript_106327:3-755(-)
MKSAHCADRLSPLTSRCPSPARPPTRAQLRLPRHRRHLRQRRPRHHRSNHRAVRSPLRGPRPRQPRRGRRPRDQPRSSRQPCHRQPCRTGHSSRAMEQACSETRCHHRSLCLRRRSAGQMLTVALLLPLHPRPTRPFGRSVEVLAAATDDRPGTSSLVGLAVQPLLHAPQLEAYDRAAGRALASAVLAALAGRSMPAASRCVRHLLSLVVVVAERGLTLRCWQQATTPPCSTRDHSLAPRLASLWDGKVV